MKPVLVHVRGSYPPGWQLHHVQLFCWLGAPLSREMTALPHKLGLGTVLLSRMHCEGDVPIYFLRAFHREKSQSWNHSRDLIELINW